VFPVRSELELPLTDRTLKIFGCDECGGTLTESFVHSCNTTFGQLGLELGERFASGIVDYGLNSKPFPADVNPPVVRSIGPQEGTFKTTAPLFAQAAIGQGEIATTPFQMAMIVQAVANNGVMMVPHVADRIEDPDGRVVRRIEPEEFRRVMRPETALTLRDLMVQVVQRGTGTAAQVPGITVAGKTGTAQVAVGDPHAWFIGFAPAENPVYAVAVIVEHGGSLSSEATGGRVAAPIAAQMFSTLLAGNP
jgi:peptidoglycan glycosyltransferase